jgi:hypothetical protein
MKRHTGTFFAKGDDGLSYEVHEFTSENGSHGEKRTLNELRTSYGSQVVRKRKGLYQIVETGVTLRCDDPNAP